MISHDAERIDRRQQHEVSSAPCRTDHLGTCKYLTMAEATSPESRVFWTSRSAGSVIPCSSTGGLGVNQVKKQSGRTPLAMSGHIIRPLECSRNSGCIFEIVAAPSSYCYVTQDIRRESRVTAARSSLSRWHAGDRPGFKASPGNGRASNLRKDQWTKDYRSAQRHWRYA